MTIPYTQLISGNRINLVENSPLPKPISIYIEPTNVCNLKCSCCPQSIPDYKAQAGYHQLMPMNTYERIIQEIRDFGGVTTIKLYFLGEPLLHKEIVSMIRLAKTAAERVEITSNGIKLTEVVAEGMINEELDYLRVSIYPETINLDKVLENVKFLRKLRDDRGKDKPNIFVKVLGDSQLSELQKLYTGIADEVSYEPFHSFGGLITLNSAPTRKACAYPFYTMIVKANGDVVPCCVAWEKSLVLGNIHSNSLMEIWNGDILHNIRRMHLNGQRNEFSACKNCDTINCTPDSMDDLTLEEYDSLRK